jgi:hypothetical protein
VHQAANREVRRKQSMNSFPGSIVWMDHQGLVQGALTTLFGTQCLEWIPSRCPPGRACASSYSNQ